MPVLQKRIHSWGCGWLGSLLVRALHGTWHVQVVDPADVREGIRHGARPVIVAFWHRHILTILAHHRGFHVCVPVSEHQDGEYVAQVMERFGLASVRGSTTRGSLKLVRGMLGLIEQGWSSAITPDGPLGPKFRVQPGFALLAQRSGLPVCPVGVAARSAWTLPSWDEFVIPKPWTRVAIAFGPLLRAEDSDSTPAFCEALRSGLFQATETARQALSQK